jgi:hypothetical protein
MCPLRHANSRWQAGKHPLLSTDLPRRSLQSEEIVTPADDAAHPSQSP